MSETRDLTGHERDVLEFLLQGEWDGASTLREQLSTAKHAGIMSPGEASFSLSVDERMPRANADLSAAPKLDDLFLRVEDGVLVGLECSRKSLPEVSDLYA